MLLDRQRRFARAILLDDPDALPAAADARLRRRLTIHRNTVCASLAGVLEAAFPLVARTLGEDGFRTAARAFVAVSPPRRAAMFAYGDGFPDFLRAAPPVGSPDWLADLARLEWACNAALFAADARPLDPAAVAGLADADAIAALRLPPVPSLSIVRSAHPIVSIRAAVARDRTPPVRPAEHALVWRAAGEVSIRRLADGEADFLEALAAGGTLADAAGIAGPGFDLAGGLAIAFADGLFAAPVPPEERPA